MSEARIIDATPWPLTRERMAQALTALGVARGSVLLVHSALSRLGYVSGGPEAVVLALLDVLGADGTLVMPTFTAHLSDPCHWQAPPVPEAWWPVLRETMPAFNPHTTPTRMMGAVCETFRSWPGCQRSAHPQDSFAALGPHADHVTAEHPLDAGFGPASPLGRLEALDASVLFLGVSFENCTAFHLGEHRADAAPLVTQGAPVQRDGTRIWARFTCPDYDSDDFTACGAAFQAQIPCPVRHGPVGQGTAHLFSLRAAAAFAESWLPVNRP